MLIQCPECEGQMSDQAVSCPHCGFPSQTTSPTPTVRRRKKPKKMRLPNGFGQISELKDRNLRKPFRAMVTVGTNDEGRPICKPLKPDAYFATYNEAYAALIAHHENPSGVHSDTTLDELYQRWFPEYSVGKAYGTIQNTAAAWQWCKPLWTMKVREIRVRHIKECLDGSKATHNTKNRMKILLNLLLDYALIYELADRNYARMYSKRSSDENNGAAKPHITYTDDEMETLWSLEGKYLTVDMTLVQCYSGWRPAEMFQLKIDDVDLDAMTYRGGVKTTSGKNRLVPIHSRIEPIVRRYYTESITNGETYLFPGSYGRQIQYVAFRKDFNAMLKQLNINPEHRPHDGRVRFITSAKNENVDEYAIKYIVGHKINDITEGTYTKRELDWLKQEIEKVK